MYVLKGLMFIHNIRENIIKLGVILDPLLAIEELEELDLGVALLELEELEELD